MNTVFDTDIQTIEINKTKVSNKGFAILEEKILEKGWELKKNSITHIIYKKIDSDYDFIELKVEIDKIYVVVPIGNCQYETFFNCYFLACEFVEMHL